MSVKSTDWATIGLFWKTGLQSKRSYLVSALLYPLGQVFIYMITPFFIGKTLGSLAAPGGDPMHYIPYFLGAAVLGVTFNRFGFGGLLAYQADTMGRLQTIALDALLKRSTGFHNNNIGGKLVSDAIDFPVAFNLLSNAYFANLLPFGIVLGVGSILVFSESWILGMLLTVMAVFAIGSGILQSRKRVGIRARRLKATKAVTGHLADTIVNVQTVKTFAREHSELTTHIGLNNKLRSMRIRDWVEAGHEGNARIAILYIFQLIFLIIVIKLVQNDPAMLAVGIFGFSFMITLSNRLFEVNQLLKNVEEGLLNASPMTEIIMDQAEVQDRPEATDLKVSKGAIDLNNVNFEYRDSASGQTVFERLNLHVAPGEKIGLVGPSGGGKSTLTRLLLRFEDISDGQISIDGQDIASVTQESLRRSISYVPQEPLMFHRTIRENIAYSNPNASHNAIAAAAKSAHADSFINQLPQKYETIVGERGVKLSGGQRQRVAIARAILKDAPILILDEATSALDSESEHLIQDALWKLMEGRTALVIAHRLSTIQKMDRIIVLDNGQIAEQGTHKQLLQAKGLYAKLWKHQSGGFIEE